MRKVCLLVSLCCVLSAYGQEVVAPDTLGEAHAVAWRKAHLNTGLQTSLSDSTFLRLGLTTLSDAFRRLPGVNLRDYGGAGGLKTVNVQGLGAAHTTLLLDGMPVNDLQQGAIDLQRYSLDEMAAVTLNIADQPQLLTSVRELGTAVLQLETAGERHNSVQLRQASWNTWEPLVQLSRRLKNGWKTAVSGRYYQGDNNYPFQLVNGKVKTTERRNHSEMDAGNLRLSLSGNGLQTSAGYYQSQRNLPGIVTLYTNEATEETMERSAYGQVHYRLPFYKGWNGKFGGKYGFQESHYQDIDGQYPGGRLSQHYWTHEGYATAGIETPNLLAASTITLQGAFATDYSFTQLHSNLTGEPSAMRHQWQQALSLRAGWRQWELTTRLIGHAYWNRRGAAEQTVAGAVTEKARNFQRLTPSVTLNYRAASSTVRWEAAAYYKEFFRAPSFPENYYYHLGNSQLSPELTRQRGLTASAELRRGGWQGDVSGSGYIGRVRNRIVSIPYNLFIWRTVNMGEVHTAGFDLASSVAYRHAGHLISLSAKYAFQRVEDMTAKDAGNSTSYGKQLAYSPPHTGHLALAWENPWCSFSSALTASGQRWSTNEHVATTQLPAYSVVDCHAYRTFHIHRITLNPRLSLLNICNHQYDVIRRYPMPGRSYQISLTVKF